MKRTIARGIGLFVVLLPACGSARPDSSAEAGDAAGDDAGARDAAADDVRDDARAGDATRSTADGGGTSDAQPEAEGGQSYPTHVKTVDYGDALGTPTGIYPAGEMKWLSMVQISNPASADAYASAGVLVTRYTYAIDVVGYMKKPENPLFSYLGGVAGTANQTAVAFQKDCAGNALAEPTYGAYLLDWSQPATAAAYEKAFIAPDVTAHHHVDFYYVDGDDEVGSTQYPQFADAVTQAPAFPCTGGKLLTQQELWSAAGAGLGSMGVPVLVDHLNSAHDQVAPAVSFANALAGGRSEGSYTCNGTETGVDGLRLCIGPGSSGYATDAAQYRLWAGDEDTEIAEANAGKIELIQTEDYGDDAASPFGQKLRLYAFASVLMTYSYETTYWWYLGEASVHSDPGNPSGEEIFPESELVPLHPVVPEPATGDGVIAKLQDAGGAYYREYRDCAYDGVRIGRCVVVVNPSPTATVPFPLPAYGMTCATCGSLVQHNGPGAEIENGGTVTFDGPPAPPTMGPDSAIIVVDKAQ